MRAKFKLPFSTMKEVFREFKDSKGADVTQEFRKLLFAIDTIPVCTHGWMNVESLDLFLSCLCSISTDSVSPIVFGFT